MESVLFGFREEPNLEKDTAKTSSSALRLVPWLSWEEWIFVKNSLFSDSPHSVSEALNRISAWRSRGCLPVVVEVTASIVEIQQKDPYFRADQSDEASLSEEMLSMLYCMAIVRLVNCGVEKTRKKELVSIAEAAEAIGIPRMLIDIRHEGSHRDLPSLKVVRSASVKALDWLKSYYWEPQSKEIPFQGVGNAKVKKEIKSKIRELAICLKDNGSSHSSTSLGKRVKHGELLFGRNKHLALVVGKSQKSRSGGSKKQIAKILKSILRLYSTFSSEIVHVLLEYLLKFLSSSGFKENADDATVDLTAENILSDWNLIIVKLWNKEPELLLNLLNAVLDMIETQEDVKCEGESYQRHHLSSLFAWLVGSLCKAPSAASKMPKGVLVELLRKCLLVSRLCNKQLMDSAIYLAVLMDDTSLLDRVRKVSTICLSNLEISDDDNSLLNSKNISQFEECIHEAARKLESVKQQIMKKKNPMAMDCESKRPQVWTLAKSWNPCPIGMLPRAAGSSGFLPVLDNIDNQNQNQNQNQVSEREDSWKLIKHSAKRDATLDLKLLDNSTVKKMRETQEEIGELNNVVQIEEDEGWLMVDGVWKRVMEEELQAIKSEVRILV
ncbi:uncharacterized protein [Arachis hypogaea]|uniref:uncharacterized protein n=1 Tax=Arachis hypogaea TaxID=3818 RepID=UPI000DECAC4E|nr:uncharacterized protein LOC112702120 [Arachis hypogaea]QHO26935.1 Ribosomal biogenesis proteinL [Arachis hypogaea]